MLNSCPLFLEQVGTIWRESSWTLCLVLSFISTENPKLFFVFLKNMLFPELLTSTWDAYVRLYFPFLQKMLNSLFLQNSAKTLLSWTNCSKLNHCIFTLNLNLKSSSFFSILRNDAFQAFCFCKTMPNSLLPSWTGHRNREALWPWTLTFIQLYFQFWDNATYCVCKATVVKVLVFVFRRPTIRDVCALTCHRKVRTWGPAVCMRQQNRYTCDGEYSCRFSELQPQGPCC